ncbi:MAG: hypothetical protein WEB89_09515 [Balneolales bacterium]
MKYYWFLFSITTIGFITGCSSQEQIIRGEDESPTEVTIGKAMVSSIIPAPTKEENSLRLNNVLNECTTGAFAWRTWIDSKKPEAFGTLSSC